MTKKKVTKKVMPGDMLKAFAKKKAKNWIAGAIKKPGALHKQLGVAEDKKIPAKKINAAAKKGGLLAKRANLAKTLKSFSKSKKAETKKHESKAFEAKEKKHGKKKASK